MEFPLYRKYINEKSYFKITSLEGFTEIQTIGKNYRTIEFVVKILPDRYLVQDMIELKDGRWAEISEAEYETFLESCSRDFKKAT